VPIISRENTQNGGKDGDSTIQSGLGLDQKVLRLLETEYSAFSSESQRTEAFGAPDSSLETTLQTLRYGRDLQTAWIQSWSSMFQAATPLSASSPTTRDENDGKAKP
jgi:hypothetical protein